MDILHVLELMFEKQGYLVIWLGLLLEFIALPFPGETTMAYAGFLSYKGLLDWRALLLFAYLGTTMGITITYWIGKRAGLPFIKKFGKWFFLPPHKLDKTRYWFDKYGAGLIFLGYFIPGVRHFTGYFAGMIALPFRKFIMFAYSGALIWTILFIGIGKIFGPQWKYMFHLAATYSMFASLAIAALILAIIGYRYRRALARLYKELLPNRRKARVRISEASKEGKTKIKRKARKAPSKP